MKIVFKDIGEDKVSKIVEVAEIPQYRSVTDFCLTEAHPYMPKEGSIELIAQDGLPDFLSNQFKLVHMDQRYVYRGMGSVIIYR